MKWVRKRQKFSRNDVKIVPICTHQGSAAEQDHKDDEGLKPAVFHDLVAGFPQPPPGLTQTVGDIDITAPTVSDTN